ncbi:uncharacterized protein SCHCODRAFT_02519126, partial [Schizophyllum commune H4-8]|uniref:uncharacterized protein n=1 Tax=Schizophyllum commune (strain H4-8 / FGSC 9210) TaxID=578458 RepID=UPI00215F9764
IHLPHDFLRFTGKQRKIECALCAHPPNLPTFRISDHRRQPSLFGTFTDALRTIGFLQRAPSIDTKRTCRFRCSTGMSIALYLSVVLPNSLDSDSAARRCLTLARRAITSTTPTCYGNSHLTTINADAALIFRASMHAQQACN